MLDWASINSWLGTMIGIVGLLIAWYQFKEKKRFQNIARSENWFNYERANMSNGMLQKAIDLYKATHRNNIDHEVLGLLLRAEAFGNETYMSFIRQINFIEPSFNEIDIKRWENEGKITKEKAELFRKFVVSDGIDEKRPRIKKLWG